MIPDISLDSQNGYNCCLTYKSAEKLDVQLNLGNSGHIRLYWYPAGNVSKTLIRFKNNNVPKSYKICSKQ